jgi:sulfoquinovose isomerase
LTASTPGDYTWRRAELDRLLTFAQRSHVVGQPFGWLDDQGELRSGQPYELWITARMTHVFALASLLGHPGARGLARAGVVALAENFADAEFGGWFRSVDADGRPVDDRKACYEHAFVLLAAASASAAKIEGAPRLLEQAVAEVDTRFWRESEGRCLESYDRRWSAAEAYRGANSNMHSVEAFLAAASATGQARWIDRALSIADHVINIDARGHGWRIPEHFDADWVPVLDYNESTPADQFRPYGSTPGHWLEWARLLIDIEAAALEPPPWLLPAAQALFAEAVRLGWGTDSTKNQAREGFLYTLDWQDRPVVAQRMHWVVAEAVLAADALARRTGDRTYGAYADRWWRQIDEHFVDLVGGSWHHELDSGLQPSNSVWTGKPDAYHAVQALLLPDLPFFPAPASALRMHRLSAGQ